MVKMNEQLSFYPYICKILFIISQGTDEGKFKKRKYIKTCI